MGNLMCELPHYLLSDLRFTALKNKEILEKSQNLMGTKSSVQSPL